MPVIFRHKGIRFFFFSNEGEPLEPLHIHVRGGKSVAKFWIEQNINLADSYGFSSGELNDLAKLVEQNKELIERCWNEHFNS